MGQARKTWAAAAAAGSRARACLAATRPSAARPRAEAQGEEIS